MMRGALQARVLALLATQLVAGELSAQASQAAEAPAASTGDAAAATPTGEHGSSALATTPSAAPAPDAETAAEGAPSGAPDPVTQDTRTPDPVALLAQLDAEMSTEGLSSPESTSRLTLYGFTDVGFYKFFMRKGSPLRTILFPNSAFAVGNLNLYLAGDLGKGWRSLAEVRFTYLPNGSRSVSASGVERTDTLVSDYTNLGRMRRYGGIFIERAWLEYAVSSALTVRAGSWLTPYGIWNEDHGSPTIIPVTRPYAIGLELLPERQTGVLAFGDYYTADSLALGYAVGVSNGRGPIAEYADLDENKALTLRLNGSHRGAGVLSFGASGYFGRSTDSGQSLTLDGGSPRVEDVLTEQYDELALGLDVRYVRGGFHAQSEFLIRDQVFTEEGRPVRIGNQFQPDNRRYGTYALFGYRFDWFGLMPYVTGEYFSILNVIEPNRPATTDIYMDFGLGLNARPTDSVTLKLEGNLGVFDVENAEGSAFEHSVPAIQAQAAWVF